MHSFYYVCPICPYACPICPCMSILAPSGIEATYKVTKLSV